MKHKLLILISGLYLMIMITLSTGCVISPATRATPHYKHRNVWVNEVYYNQVYYVEGGKTVIIEQKEIPHKKYKKHHDNGNGHNKRKH